MGSDVTNFSRDRVYMDQDADDLALIARCRAGETAAFEGLVVRYQRVLFTVAVRMLGDADAAGDAAQNAFIKAYQKLETFNPSRFFGSIYRILVNECLNARRGHSEHEPLTAAIASVGGPEEAFEVAERRGRVQAAILALPIEYREVIVLQALHGPVGTRKSARRCTCRPRR